MAENLNRVVFVSIITAITFCSIAILFKEEIQKQYSLNIYIYIYMW